ncbi:uncharacterized protein LOC129759699 [Uranotaenia lowii]|uniref:uncharacterized protein LOC129759699 n=1 Tax=Uranotaenia lowii TaxID=190385 RepID=UPI002478B379|nr:uncharacterized protein LOC129759699 [Uranotaenia lowii]
MATETETTQQEAPAAETEATPVEKPVTKRTLRLDVWRKVRELKLATSIPFTPYNKIPSFKGSDKAAELLAGTEEFQKAKSVKVNIDLSQEQIKLEVLKAKKTLFIPSTHRSASVYAKIKPCNLEEMDADRQKRLIKLKDGEDTFDEIDINNVEPLDIVVVGSCVVSREGHRIGKGNGYVDLDIGILTELGIITKDTLIVTTVHDSQVVDTLPGELFQPFDLALDMIVTPTEVIRTKTKLPRPTGIHWGLLSSRRIEIVPVLKAIKEREEKAGKTIELKDEDTDVESYTKKAKQRRMVRGQNRRRRRSEKQNGESHDDGAEKTDGETGGDGERREGGGRGHRRPRFRKGPRRGDKDVGESGAEKSEGEGGYSEKEGGDGKKQNRRRRLPRNGEKGERRKPSGRVDRDLCIRVSNITRSLRIKDLKKELRARNCNPIFITWNGYHGKCFLHFAKNPELGDEQAGANLLQQLENLVLTVNHREKEGGGSQEVTLKCEIMKRKEGGGEGGGDEPAVTNGTVLEGSRIETTDVTAV